MAENVGSEVAKPPEVKNAHAGGATGELKAKIQKEGARTVPV